MSIAEQLRDYIINSGISRYEISRQTGVAQSVLARFLSGETSLSLSNIEKLAAYFELELKPKKRIRRRG